MARNVGIYARVSKAEAESTSSVPVQLADCRERAAEEGWTVVDEFVDEGISAWNPKRKRPEYERLLGGVEAGSIDTILVRETERLLRSAKDAVRIADLAEAGRLRLVASTLEGDIDFRRARDRKDFRDRASSAQFYSDFLSEKVKRTKEATRIAGKYQGGGLAYGFDNATGGGVTVNPEQAALIHDAVIRLGRGDSLYRIAADWNESGLRSARGARWDPTRLRRMLSSDHLTGERGYPPILSDVEAAIVRQHIKPPKPQGGRPPGRRFAATALLFCAECGTKMTAGSIRYHCSVGHGGCGRVSIRATPLERHLIEQSTKHYPKRSRPDDTETAPDTAPILAELREVEQQLSDITEALGDGTLAVSVAGPAAKALEDRRRALTEALARALPPAATGKGLFVVELPEGVFVTDEDKFKGPRSAAAFMKRWEDRKLTGNEIENLRDFMASRVDRAEVRRGRGPAADRVTVTWR